MTNTHCSCFLFFYYELISKCYTCQSPVLQHEKKKNSATIYQMHGYHYNAEKPSKSKI